MQILVETRSGNYGVPKQKKIIIIVYMYHSPLGKCHLLPGGGPLKIFKVL